MINITKKILFAVVAVGSFSCTTIEEEKYTIMDEMINPVSRDVTIDITAVNQTIDGFSASDCWSGNFVGQYWDDSERSQIAEWLFSQGVDDDKNPLGIGLSMWRFNLGGGTSEQGADSNISDETRRAECFLNADGTYDWTKHAGQRYFLERAVAEGCESFVMFSNSPPVHYTKNGKGYSSSGSYGNLQDDCYDDFAEYIGTVLQHFKDEEGIEFAYISPVNEPQYDWSSSNQEGSGWQNSEVKTLAQEIDKSITSRNLSTQILVNESADYRYLYETSNSDGRKNCAKQLFYTESDNYIGDISSVAPIIAAHGYWVDGNWDLLEYSRQAVRERVDMYDIKLYQTEWSMLGDNYDDDNVYPGHDDATYLDIALHMSKVMHHDLVNANVSSWSYWVAMDTESWSHKNRFLLIMLNPYDSNSDLSLGGTGDATKTLWVLGNYSRFIRPNYKRVDHSMDTETEYFFGSSYLSPEGDKLVVVYTNLTGIMVQPKITIEGGKKIKSGVRYITDTDNDLKLIDDIEDVDKDLKVEGESVVTFVFDLE
ncbi:MAG: glycoside hydrolase [Rikenellaceae bacterium]